MPELVASAIVTAGLEFDIALLITNATQISYALLTLSAYGYSAHQRRRMQSKAAAAYNASLRDRTLTVRGTLEERELVMGRVRKGGYFYPVGTTGADSERFVFIVVMAGHSIQGVNTNYFDEHELTLDGDGYVTSAPFAGTRAMAGSATISMSGGTGSVTLPHTPVAGSVLVVVDLGVDAGTLTLSTTVVGNTVTASYGSYSGTVNLTYQYLDDTKFARVRWMLGSDSQAAFSDLVTQFPSLWTSAHRLRGCTYAVIELLYNADIFPQGLPNFSADINGANTVEDPRTSTVGFSQNNALLARWYALHSLGGRRTTGQLDEPSFIAAANVCDTSVDYGAGSTALYQAGYVAKSGQAPAGVLDEICEAMAGRWGYTQGRIRVRGGGVGTPVAAITTDWLLTRAMSTRARRPRSELRNVLQGTLNDETTGYQTVQFARVVDSAAVTDDGGELAGELEFQAISRNGQAQQVAATMLRYERQALTVTLTLKMRAWTLQLFDVVAITMADMGWSGKLFEVLDRSFSLGGGVTITFKEIDSSIFAFGTGFTENDPAPNTELPDSRVVPTVGTLTVTSSATVLPAGAVETKTTVTWPTITDIGVTQGGFVEVSWADSRLGTFGVVRADDVQRHQFVGLQSGVHYVFMARAVNGVGVRGNWSAAATHQVARKTAAAANVSSFAGTVLKNAVRWAWARNTEADASHTEVRSADSGWGTYGGTLLWRGDATDWVERVASTGTLTRYAKHIDTSGNAGATAASASVTVATADLVVGTGDLAVEAVAKVYDFTPLAGPITRTNVS